MGKNRGAAWRARKVARGENFRAARDSSDTCSVDVNRDSSDTCSVDVDSTADSSVRYGYESFKPYRIPSVGPPAHVARHSAAEVAARAAKVAQTTTIEYAARRERVWGHVWQRLRDNQKKVIEQQDNKIARLRKLRKRDEAKRRSEQIYLPNIIYQILH